MFQIDEMVELFDISDVNQSASAFSLEKLRWLNQQRIMLTPAAELGDVRQQFAELAHWEKAGLGAAIENCAARHGITMGKLGPGLRGAIAQLGERLHGMQEVGDSIPPRAPPKT